MKLARYFGLVSWAMATKIPPMAYGFVQLLVLYPILSKTETGRYSLVFAIFTFLTLFNKFLILHPMIKLAAVPGKFSDYTRTGFQLSLIFYSVSGFLLWMAAPVLAEMLRIPTQHIRFVPLLLAVMLMREVGFCVQQTSYNTRNIFVIEAVYWFGSAIGFVYLAIQGILTTAFAALMVNMLAAAASSITAVALGFNGAKLWGRFRKSEFIEILRYGFITIGIGLSSFLINGNLDIILVGWIYNAPAVAIYTVAKKSYQMISALSQSVSLVIMPYSSKLQAEHRIQDLKQTYEKTVGVLVILLTMIVIVGWLSADTVFGLLFHGQYAGSTLLFCIMLLGAPFEAVYNVSGNILYGIGAAGTVAVISIVSLIVWLAISIPGIYISGWTGAAAGLAAAMITLGSIMHYVTSKRLKTNSVSIVRTISHSISELFGKH